MDVTIVGIDCATDPKKTGIALGFAEEDQPEVLAASTGKYESPAAIICDWIRDRQRVLLALDAPLGWPAALGEELSLHKAGNHLTRPADELFRRETDRFVKRLTEKQPLDVGADRIARTAHSALSLLEELHDLTGSKIDLAWSPAISERIQAIEVYPAGTLAALGLPATGYKKPADRAVRKRIQRGIEEHVNLSLIPQEPLLENADLLDAVICIVSAADFLNGRTVSPPDPELAEKEGWIWVRTPD